MRPIEAHIRTGCDGRHADQQIRGAVVLPHGTAENGKTVRILVFAKGAKAEEALATWSRLRWSRGISSKDPEKTDGLNLM